MKEHIVFNKPNDDGAEPEAFEEPQSESLREAPYIYSDINTRRTVYNELELPEDKREKDEEEDVGAKEKLAVSPTATYTEYSEEWATQQNAFRSTEERGVSPAAELFVTDELEGKTPYEVLGVAEGDAVEAHKAYRTLMRSIHPDVLNAEIDTIVQKVLGGSGTTWGDMSDSLKKIVNWYDKHPERLSEEKLAALAEADRKKYVETHQAWEAEKPSAEGIRAIKEELKQRAEKKARILNAAWDQIKKGLSFESIVGVASHWNTTKDDGSHFLYPHQTIRLEGDARLYRNLDFTVTDTGGVALGKAHPTYLEFASGWDKDIGIYEGYREAIPLKTLFAFLEHRDGRIVSSVLLSDIAEEYELNNFDVKRLQDLLHEQAEPSRTCQELGVVPPFEEVSMFALDEVQLDKVAAMLVRNKGFRNEDLQRLEAAGYTREALTSLERFVSDARIRAEEAIRNRNNRVTYYVAREHGMAFDAVRRESAKESDAGVITDGDVIAEVLRDLRDAQSKQTRFTKAIQEIQQGPTYTLYENAEHIDGFRVGVEYGRDGLRLILPKQEELNRYDFSSFTEVFFNRNDIGIMREIAYGRSVTTGTAKAIGNS